MRHGNRQWGGAQDSPRRSQTQRGRDPAFGRDSEKHRDALTFTALAALAIALALILIVNASTADPIAPKSTWFGGITKTDKKFDRSLNADESAAMGDPFGDPDIDIYSYYAILDGTEYIFPSEYTAFAENGWEIDGILDPHDDMGDDMERILAPDDKITVQLANGSHKMIVYFANLGEAQKPVRECSVIGVGFGNDYEQNGTAIIFPGGITYGSSKYEVLACYGEPSLAESHGASRSFDYRWSFSGYTIYFDQDTGLVFMCQMRNPHVREKLPEVTSPPPDVVLAYQAQAVLGDSWDSFGFGCGGALYSLPVPVSVLIENGWAPVDDEDQMVAAGAIQATPFEIRYGNHFLDTEIRNYSETEQPAKYCFVTLIRSSKLGPRLPVELPKGITDESSIKDFLEAYGRASQTKDSINSTEYIWGGEFFNGLSVTVFNDTNEIVSIKFDHSPKRIG